MLNDTKKVSPIDEQKTQLHNRGRFAKKRRIAIRNSENGKTLLSQYIW